MKLFSSETNLATNNNNINFETENSNKLEQNPSCFSSVPPTVIMNCHQYSLNTEKKEELQEEYSSSIKKQEIINDKQQKQSQKCQNISQFSYNGVESPQSKSQIKFEHDEIANIPQNEYSDSNKSMSYFRQSNNNKNLGIDKKISKRSAGRPLKKNFASAVRQKRMKEFDYEETFGSQYSSENYQLLITALLVFGSDSNKGNIYIVRKPDEGDKKLNVVQLIDDHDSQESKRMWLTYYKLSRILNQKSKEIMMALWTIFQQYIETIYLINCRKQMLEEQFKQQQQSMISTIMQCPTISFKATHLEDIASIKKLFDSSNNLYCILSDKKYHFFTNTNFGPCLFGGKGENNKKDLLQKLDYSELEKTLLISNNLTKSDFIYILFSCAICDYFNMLSPYYQILCHLL